MSNPYNLSNYAKEINWSDMERHIEKHFWPKPNDNSKDVMKEWFAQIAGRDNIIQGTELEVFFKELEDYSNRWAGGKELSERDIAHFAVKNDGFFSKIFSDKNPKAIASLINSLKNINSEKLKNEQPILPNEKYFKNDKLVKEVLRNEDGTVQENKFDKKGNVTRVIIKDKDGNLVEDKSFDNKGNITEHTYPKNEKFNFKEVVEKQITKAPEGNITKHSYILENGTIHELHYDKDGNIFKQVNKYEDSTYVEEKNKDGQVTKLIRYDEKGNITFTTQYSYDKNGILHKEKTNYIDNSSYSVEKNYNSEGNEISTITKDENGNIQATEKYYYDKNGHKTKTEQYGADGKLNLTSIETKNSRVDLYPDGKSVEVSFDSNDNRIEIEKDKNGVVTKTTINKMYSNGSLETTEETADEIVITKRNDKYQIVEVINQTSAGQLKDVTTFNYDKNGQEIKTVSKDAQGNIISTTENVYDPKGRRTKSITRDKNGAIIKREISLYTDSKKGSLECFMEFDGSGKVIVSYETIRNNEGKIVRQTLHNNEIDEKYIYDFEKGTTTSYDANNKIID